MASPTSRSLEHLRKQGYTAEVVEKFIPFANIRKDLFGMFDILAFKKGYAGVLGVQTTSMANMSDRKSKIVMSPYLEDWLNCKNRVQVHGWRKIGKAGKRKTWEVAVDEI